MDGPRRPPPRRRPVAFWAHTCWTWADNLTRACNALAVVVLIATGYSLATGNPWAQLLAMAVWLTLAGVWGARELRRNRRVRRVFSAMHDEVSSSYGGSFMSMPMERVQYWTRRCADAVTCTYSDRRPDNVARDYLGLLDAEDMRAALGLPRPEPAPDGPERRA